MFKQKYLKYKKKYLYLKKKMIGGAENNPIPPPSLDLSNFDDIDENDNSTPTPGAPRSPGSPRSPGTSNEPNYLPEDFK